MNSAMAEPSSDASPSDASRSVVAALGKTWAHTVANTLRDQGRDVVGAWPGTLREARSRVLMGLPAARQPMFDVEVLQALARECYDAARRCWDEIAAPDPEP
jgi:hypothetical protein